MAWWCRQAGAYLVAQLVPSGGALDDDGAAAGGQVALGAQVGLLTALELNASAPPRDESSESMSSSTAGRPGARRGAAGAAEGLCGAEGLLPGGLSSRSPSSSDKRLSTSAIAQHQPTPVAQSQKHGGEQGRGRDYACWSSDKIYLSRSPTETTRSRGSYLALCTPPLRTQHERSPLSLSYHLSGPAASQRQQASPTSFCYVQTPARAVEGTRTPLL